MIKFKPDPISAGAAMPVESEPATGDVEVKVDWVGRAPCVAACVVAEEVLVPAQHSSTQLEKQTIMKIEAQ